tara:strand:+ start:23 stop:625 length:603 start_codon:yes stop_codon:yes gene_type:complete
MSAISAPFGFRVSFHNSGQVRSKAYTIASGYAINLFSGDPVKLATDGTVQLGTSDGTRSGTTDGVKLLGIFQGCRYIDPTNKPTISPFWPSGVTGTEIVAWILDDPEALFNTQYANPGTPGTTSMLPAVGKQSDFIVASPGGSTRTGLSTTSLSVLQSTAGQFQITGFANEIADSITDAYAVVIVRINEHQYKASVNTVS